MEIVCGNCGPINEHKKSCPLSVCPQCARFREKLDKEKLVQWVQQNNMICGPDAFADAILKYLAD
jgi:hypothetical protein